MNFTGLPPAKAVENDIEVKPRNRKFRKQGFGKKPEVFGTIPGKFRKNSHERYQAPRMPEARGKRFGEPGSRFAVRDSRFTKAWLWAFSEEPPVMVVAFKLVVTIALLLTVACFDTAICTAIFDYPHLKASKPRKM
ncbi:hypothetical protein DFP72DRAFT_854327 [Ephemerocybe angulata]|uniref:Uncharacterized protein n=1 Tax=Ephemerocybe angulata TaxID=980116 RepID=A0A8H6LXE9_9AGAR|nr:hypothetical protein DFP72DRAFT_854327 [Tulosesus angulatus]